MNVKLPFNSISKVENTTRDLFFIPKDSNGNELTYLCGNSLGLQPKSVQSYIQTELDDWAKLGVDGHFHGQNPWLDYHKLLTLPMANIVGALPHEVVVMNTLTVNLHLLLASFYKPKGKKYKILTEAKAFSSDYYVIESQVKWHGFDSNSAILEVTGDSDSGYISTASFCESLDKNKDEIALILLGGVNYYTGQYFNLEKITVHAHSLGIRVGVDLAHAAGNVALKLHDWNIDFAAWCSYKYLNAGPGGPGGVFVHERHGLNPDTFRLAGWWGHDSNTRFKMEKGFVPQSGAEGWQLSNAQILAFASLRASLEIFEKAGIDNLIYSSRKLTEQLLEGLHHLNEKYSHVFQVITPTQSHEHGCQISISLPSKAKEVSEFLQQNGVITDYRQPDILRVSPVPLYNSIQDIDMFLVVFEKWFEKQM